MSTTSKLDQLASELFNGLKFDKLSKFDKELLISFLQLEEAFNPTDFEQIEWDNINE